MKNSRKVLFLMAFSALLLTGCENTKKELGLTHDAPDEFTVVRRAPLAMPPDYSLRPPAPGMPRPQDAITSQQAQSTLFGGNAAVRVTPSNADAAFLHATGADQASPDIRAKVDSETSLPATNKQKPVAERLLGWVKPKPDEPEASVVDPVAETARLKKDQQTGQPPTAGGDTPSQVQ